MSDLIFRYDEVGLILLRLTHKLFLEEGVLDEFNRLSLEVSKNLRSQLIGVSTLLVTHSDVSQFVVGGSEPWHEAWVTVNGITRPVSTGDIWAAEFAHIFIEHVKLSKTIEGEGSPFSSEKL